MPDGAHVYASFNHITGYTSNYYTYLWAQVRAVFYAVRFSLSLVPQSVQYICTQREECAPPFV